MKPLCIFALLLVVATAGCVTKAKARAQAQAAFQNGLREGLLRAQESAAVQGPSVYIQGPVQTPVLPWTPDLTLAKALVRAGYTGAKDPQRIVVTRNGEQAEISTERLLEGEDFKLEPGDRIELE